MQLCCISLMKMFETYMWYMTIRCGARSNFLSHLISYYYKKSNMTFLFYEILPFLDIYVILVIFN